MKLKEFETVKNCEKCGRDTFREMITKKGVMRFIGKRTYVAEDTELVKQGAVITPEHLSCTCDYCGYVWKEKCKS